MKFHEEFLTVLDVKRNQDNLILRLDASDEFGVEEYKQTIIELELVNCKNLQSVIEEIKRYIGELVWNYEFLEKERKLKILWESSDEIIISCNQIIEKRDDLTIEELLLKFNWLTKKYQIESNSSSEGWRKYRKLRDLLKTEIANDLRNWEKRKAFFEQNKSEQVGKTEAVIKLCHKILNFIKQVDGDKR